MQASAEISTSRRIGPQKCAGPAVARVCALPTRSRAMQTKQKQCSSRVAQAAAWEQQRRCVRARVDGPSFGAAQEPLGGPRHRASACVANCAVVRSAYDDSIFRPGITVALPTSRAFRGCMACCLLGNFPVIDIRGIGLALCEYGGRRLVHLYGPVQHRTGADP